MKNIISELTPIFLPKYIKVAQCIEQSEKNGKTILRLKNQGFYELAINPDHSIKHDNKTHWFMSERVALVFAICKLIEINEKLSSNN